MRFRQFVFVAEDSKSAVVDIGATLGLSVCYNDPNVGAFGLHNALLPIGGDLIEVVAPIREGDHGGPLSATPRRRWRLYDHIAMR